MQPFKKYIVASLFLVSLPLLADNLPRVTGLDIVGDQLTWDGQDGATGYNVHLDYRYYDTVRDVENYTVSEPGRYHVISFNDNGEFGVTRNLDEVGQSFDLFSVNYDGEDTGNIQYTYNYPVLIVQNTCRDVGPGESCIASCPSTYQNQYGGTEYSRYLSGGACSTSDIVEADAFVSSNNYKCTVPTFSGEVVAQGICVMND